jgi:carboxypeptidase C (cathepsin A)
MASIVIDHLKSEFGNDRMVATVGVYCHFKNETHQDAMGILRALLKQLVQRSTYPSMSIKALYEQGLSSPLTLQDVSDALTEAIKAFNRVFIVMDALDECQDSSLSELLPAIFAIQEACSASFLATSRPVAEIEEQFGQNQSLEIRADTNDVLLYLEANVPKVLRRSIVENQKLKKDIVGTISQAVDGM